MKKCSSEDGCMERVSFACKCTSPNLYFCDNHFTKHVRTLGNHITECLIIKLNPDQIREWLPKLKDLIAYLKHSRKRILSNSMELIGCIENETRIAVKIIKELVKTSVDLLSERGIYKENYERIQCITPDNSIYTSDRAGKIQSCLKDLYKSYNYERNWKECEHVIFSSNPAGGLLSIDLNTFNLSKLDYAPKIGQYCHACKIDQNTYFFHGGRINKDYRAESYLINIKDKKYKKLQDGPKKHLGGGSALMNNKVYIFGGHDGSSLNTCDAFDLKTTEWKSITALPQASHCITAAMLGKDIILSGYHLDCCYSYNDSTFTKNFALPKNAYKIVCEGWVYADSILYENKDKIPSKWTFYEVNPWNSYLWAYCVFKKKQFIYFIDSGDCLMRIDTILKKVERILFTC